MLARSLPLVLDVIAERLGGPLVIVDVGAQTLATEAHAYQPLIDAGLAVRVIGFEPQADRAAARRATDPGAVIVEGFIGDGAAHRFHLNNVSGTSSLLPLDPSVCGQIASLAGLRTVATETVRTVRLDVALAAEGPVDFLKLDIQGVELPALQGGADLLRRTAVVQVEVEFATIYAGQPLFAEVDQHLRGSRFGLIDLLNLARRPPVSPSGRAGADRLLWADAVYAAEAPNDRALLGQALVFAGVYRKFSLAERALERYDQRHGTALAALIEVLDP